jgi:serine/threonine protein kinase/formylglycine-generating enzyme required for sulfatase activity
MAGQKEEATELSPAEAAFVEFLAAQDSDHPVEFEQFVARHHGLEQELSRLHEDWLSVARVLRRGREEATPRAEVLQELCLDSEGEGLKLEFAGELVRRLACARTPADRYEPRGEIARGGMGVIYRVWDPQLRRQLAMKVILARRDVATPEERGRAMHRALARFLEEAQVTSQLDHPGIVPVHDLGIDSRGRVYFTMRLVRGRDFRRILELVLRRREGWTLARALGVLLKVCEAAAYAHSKGVIHRDLKPANVMVGRFGEVYVMDWGLARVVGRRDSHDLRIATDDTTTTSGVDTDVRRYAGQTPGSPLLTMDGRVVGTPSYMSPEQAKGQVGEIGPTTDVYAIGTMLYHLLTGQAPYVPAGAEISPPNVYNMLLSGPPAPAKAVAPHAPDELVAICDKAMARRPADRYAGPLEMAADIEAFLDRRPVTARPPTLRYLARLYFERNRVVATTVAAATLVLAAVIAGAWTQSAAKQRENERLLDLRSAQVLAGSVEELFPALPRSVPAMDRWLAEVDSVLSRAPAWRAQLAAARAANDLALVGLLEDPLREMERLDSELRPLVRSWRDRAQALARVTLEQHDRDWREATDDVARLPVYGGLRLTKQLGLVPLRKDSRSGLWEFWHVLSGERPEEDEESPSGYAVTPGMGIVLVLIPGGRSVQGSPPSEADRDPTNEPTTHEVDVAPFFLSKFEATQAQWQRVMNERPSLYGPGTPILTVDLPRGRPPEDGDVHPVESVNWPACSRFLGRVGLRFPQEHEWEHAARGGTSTAFWWQVEAGTTSPAGFENVADRCCKKRTSQGFFDFEDHYAAHAPVGSFRPNPFGLFDVAGNVSEWCEDWFRSENAPDDVPRRRIVRGGTWISRGDFLRSAARQWDNPIALNLARGLRAARSIDD